MWENGKGESLLQYLKSFILLFIFSIFISCATNNTDFKLSVEDISIYFNSGVESEWLKGLGYIKNNSEEVYLETLIKLFLNKKYNSIKGTVKILILDILNRYNYDVKNILQYIKTAEDSQNICSLVDSFDDSYIIDFSVAVYESNIEMRSRLIEDLGLYVLDYINVLDLYFIDDEVVKSAVLSSSGFISDEEIYPWLVDRLYEESEKISSAAVFSLSKHGSKGFSYLAKNLVYLSNRLKLITIDLLSFNKVDEAYSYYARLLEEPNQLITERVLNSYQDLGLKGVDYIIDALAVSHIGIKLQLLELLKTIPGANYLNRILFLLEYPDMQEYIIQLCFEKNAVDLIEDFLLRGEFSVESKVISYGVENSFSMLIDEKTLESFTLNYFLENYDPSIVISYLKEIGVEENYTEDYIHLKSIYSDLIIVDSFGKLNGEEEFVTKYFEIEHQKNIALQENRLFYQNMESWLETGDNELLQNSLTLKSADNPNTLGVSSEKDIFLETLDINQAFEVIKYEEALKNIKINYRKLTYRLKSFGQVMIYQKGYTYLID